MALWNRFRFRSPHAIRLIHWIFEFKPSLRAWVTFVVAALITPSQEYLINRTTRLIAQAHATRS